MKNMYDYIDFYGNYSMNDFLFNDVDSLILSMLSYAKLKQIVPKELKKYVTIEEICELFLKKYKLSDSKTEDWLFPMTYRLIEKLKNKKRFSYIKAYHYEQKVNKEGQFCAVTFRLPNGITYVSFEGTDSSVIGWKEDLEMVYKFPISSQILAQKYFDSTLNLFDRQIYVGGHSKGGNLAMYAYMYGKSYYKKRVQKVYNFDGPGFLSDVLLSDFYLEMSSKLVMVVPEESVVGMFLEHDSFQVVRSSNHGILQHDASSWECFGGFFVCGELSHKSEKLAFSLNEYLATMSMEDRKRFVDTSFAVFEKTNVTNVMELKRLKISTLFGILKEIKNIPSSTKKDLTTILRILIVGLNS